LIFALYKSDYLVIPRIHSFPALIASFVVLFAGFIADAFSWRTILGRTGYPVSVRSSLAAVGLSSFAKYIPGKVWALMGRAGYVCERYTYPLTSVTSATVTWQFIILWLGLVLGAAGLYILDSPMLWSWPVLLMWLGLTIAIFSDAAQNLVQRLFARILRKEVVIPRLTIGSTIAALPWFAVTWGLMMASFHLLVLALTEAPVHWSVGLGFPLSIIIGILAVFIPGGIGVREGVMVAYLALAGIPLQEATAISIAARLWFLVGEVFIFVVGIAADPKGASHRRRP
jgi:hypothetical protein